MATLIRTTLLVLALWTAPAQEAAWRPTQVPASGKAAEVPGPDGYGWYRAWVHVDDSFFARHEHNLFEESVGIHVQNLAGTHEVWVNGRKIGTGGVGDALYRHKVPVGTLVKGAWNEIS